ncbi:hypothetical protein FAZ69_30325 [Trinickia terrae]|uniref:Uncharacterized protein n=1 Tax=Trinickia terrae TaxID=2571161 RepID=A0A4U1HFU2_9BURK|nr:hypothetical protein [Trinickia terrae]TKC79905.1 hypothetical protein FAZ69_30325 [Trinickia terrae]
MADIRVLMVTDGNFFNYGPQTASKYDSSCFSLVTLVDALNDPANVPSIQVDTAHRRGAKFAGADPDTSQNLTYPGDFVFTDIPDLSVYDVIWLIADEGYNGGQFAQWNSNITPDEQIAIADFMAGGGGVFAVGDHDGLGACMCGGLPRIRTMRKWFEWDHVFTDPATNQVFMPNWSVGGDGTSPGYLPPSNPNYPGMTDRFDTLQPDATLFGGQQVYFFWDQSDPIPQTLMDAGGNPLTTSPDPIHAVLRGAAGVAIADFPDHMHEGEATDFSTILANGTPFNPNDAGGNPNLLSFTDKNNHAHAYPEFPNPGGYQPTPEIIAYGKDVGHATYDGPQPPGEMPNFKATNEKVHGTISVYDGYGAGVGRIVTGSTFHHYLDKNLIGDPHSDTMPGPPTNTTQGLSPATLDPIRQFYVNVVTWLARRNPAFHFWTLKNTFGADEVQSAATSGKNFPDAFYLAVEGFAPSVVGNPQIHLSGPFAATGAQFQQGSAIYSGNPNTPQRVLFKFTVLSIPGGAFPSHGSAPAIYPLEASIAFGSNTFSAVTLFELAAGADPYFTNVDASTNPPNAFYLSQDLRVFQVVPDLNQVPFINFPGGAGAPFAYVGDLLSYLNDPSNGYTQQGGTDPFQTLNEQNDLIEDSSVSNKVLGPDMQTHTAYNFAIARVRLRGSGSTASNVKVFFRMFATQSNDTDYDPQTTYLSTYDALNLPDKPLKGVNATVSPPDSLTFPFFATSGGAGDYDQGQGGSSGANEATINSTSNNETYRYFGCYLNVGDLPPDSLPGTHHCLVAQIAYDGAPLLNSSGITLSPENTDKLAQRNLQVTWSGNPGGPATHRIPQTFDNKPSLRTGHAVTTVPGYPDELMIDWGNTPKGSVASIYWPQVDSLDVVRLSMLQYADVPWTATDEHTVQCTVEHPVTYLPIPFGAGASFAGLFTIDLPIGVKAGQQFNIVVRRVRSRQAPLLAGKPGIVAQAARTESERKPPVTDWRYIVGTFQVTIPVSLEEPLLWPEENTLAIMKWRLLNTAATSRWHPVLQRYVSYLVGRVNGFGGKAGAIPASPDGAPAPGPGLGQGECGGKLVPCPSRGPGECGGELMQCRGKVCEVLFDCFGDFEGFILESCSGTHRFTTCESGIADVVLRACRERLVLTVFFERGTRDRIRQLIVTCC